MPWNLEIGDWSAVGDKAILYALGQIKIGKQVTISQRAHLCAGTHDCTCTDMALLKPPISVGDRVWICTEAFINAGVTLEEGAVIGARAVVIKNVDPWTIVAGNPARFVKSRTLK